MFKNMQCGNIIDLSVKGLNSMTINPIYRTKKILGAIADFIINYDYNTYSDLTDQDKGVIVALLIEASGRSNEYNCIIESNHADQTINFFRAALMGSSDDDHRFLDIIKTNAIEYYDETIHNLFNYVYEDYQSSKREWLDYAAKHGDPDAAYDKYRETIR